LVAAGVAVDEGETVRLATHHVMLKTEEQGLKDEILKRIVEGGNAPPILKDLLAVLGAEPKQVKNLLGILEKEGRIVRIKEDLYFSTEFVNETKKKLAEFIQREGSITPSRFGEITGSSRKYNIPLLEYFDRQRFTIRVGDHRVLRGSGSSSAGGKVE